MATDQELLFALLHEEPQALEAVIRAYGPYVTAVSNTSWGETPPEGTWRSSPLTYFSLSGSGAVDFKQTGSEAGLAPRRETPPGTSCASGRFKP